MLIQSRSVTISVLAALSLLAVATTGCGNKKSACREGAYTNTAEKFCIELPEGVVFEKVDEQPNRKVIQFKHETKGSPRMSVSVYKDPATGFTNQKAFIEAQIKNAATNGQTVIAQGKPSGAEDGAFVHISFKGGFTQQVDYVIKDGPRTASCYTNTGPNEGPRILEACKTLRILK